MCLIVLFTRQVPGCPLLLGANREERYARPSAAPRWLGGRPDVFAGQDLTAKGTWLGVNQVGLLAAVTNRRDEPVGPASGPAPRSRGLLCLDALRQRDAAAAVEWCTGHLEVQGYQPFNLLLADGTSAFAIHGGPAQRVVRLAPGVHVLADGDVDDRASVRVERARGLAEALPGDDPERALDGLQAALADADETAAPQERICRRSERAGTVSAAAIALPDSGRLAATFRYAKGPPDRVAFEDLSLALRAGPAG